MSRRKTIGRRKFIAVSAGTVAGTVLAACTQQPTATPAPQPAAQETPKPAQPASGAATAAPAPTTAPAITAAPAAKPAKFSEAPMLAELVKAGKLPPVEQRLPPEPVVVKPTNVVGKYGGTINGAAMSPETTNDIQDAMVNGLFRYSDDLSQIVPNVAQGYEFTNGNKSCVIKLRKGIKWSDGSPFTADDMIFYFEDIQFNKDIYPATGSQWQPGKQLMKVTKVDDTTVQFDFAVPNPSFALIHYSGAPAEPWFHKGYLSKFHGKYNPNADAEAKAAGFESWKARIYQKITTFDYGAMDPDLPVLGPWRPVKNDSQRQSYERNPYFFKVDTEGNQLPYIDKVSVEYTANLEVMNLKAVSGAIHVAGHDLMIMNYPVLKPGEKQGDYTVKLVNSERGADVALAFNQNHPDAVLKKIFGDVRFRQAVSLAIDRNEINELAFLGQGTPRQATINESASFYNKEWADAFAKYDTAAAGKLLDELGLDKKGADGIRLRPDGKPMAFQLEYLNNEGPKQQVCELVVKQWAKVGLKVEAAARERSFLLTRLTAGQQDCTGWHVDRQLERTSYAYGATQKLGPGGNSIIQYCKGWTDYFNSAGKQGVEPPQEAKDLFDAYNVWQQTTMGTPEYKTAAIKVHDLIAKNLWVIGITGQGPQPVVVSNKLENVFPANSTKKIWWGAANWFWQPHNGEQWFFKA
jgi:peptide/nickel transport system substrate-binding protein